MKFQIGAMTVGDILDRGLKVLLSRLPAFYFINLIVLAPILVFQLAAPTFLAQLENPGDPMALFVPALAIYFLTVILTIIILPIGTAAILHMIAQDFIDQPVSLGTAINFALSCFGRLLLTSFLLGLVLVAGFFMCIVPFFLFYVWYVFYAQTVVVERLTGTSALNRSKALTEGFRWRIVGLLALCILIGGVLQSSAGVLGVFFPSYDQIPTPKKGPFDLGFRLVPIYPNYYINATVGALVSILAQTYQVICITLLYFDLRNRKEGFDLEMAAREQLPADQP